MRTLITDVAQRLHLDAADAMVFERVNRYSTDDKPLQFAITYLPETTRAGSVLAPDANAGLGSIDERFADLGHRITGVREETLLHTGIDQDGQPFEVIRFVMRADRNALDHRTTIEDA
jgi:GntR family transcriptional regulator